MQIYVTDRIIIYNENSANISTIFYKKNYLTDF